MMAEMHPVKKVTSEKNKVFAGVCAGISYACGIKLDIIRALMILALVLCTPRFAIIGYIIAAIILPEWDELPEDYSERTGD